MVVRAVAWLAVLSCAAAVGFTGWLWIVPASHDGSSLSVARDIASVLGWGGLGVAWAATGAVLIGARPRNGLGWLLLTVGVSQAWHVGLVGYGIYGLTVAASPWPGALAIGYAGAVLFVLGVLVTPTLLLALYPEGRLPAPWWRWPVGGAAVAALHIAAQGIFLVVGDPRSGQGVVIVPDFLQGVPSRLLPPSARTFQPVWTTDEPLPVWVDAFRDGYLALARPVSVPLFVACMLVIWGGTMVRLVRTAAPQRQQLAWLVCLIMPVLLASWLAPGAGRPLAIVTLLLVPVAVAVGVLRYQLLGIDTVLRRGLVYGTLTAAVFGVYLAVTALAGRVLAGGPTVGLLAAALVAVVLAPARDRLQRAADRLVYGERRDPLRAVHRLGQQVALAGELELLAAALSSVVEAVRAPGASVVGPDGRTLATVGTESPTRAVMPLTFGGRHVGELRVEDPRGEGPYGDAGRQLLSALAPQIAVLVRAQALTEALEAERDRVVAATMAERDRLRRDLHDGLGPSLSGIGLGLQALQDALPGRAHPEPGSGVAEGLVARIKEEVGLAVVEVRRIIDDLRPAALDTVGLPEAIRRYATTVGTVLTVDFQASLAGPLPPRVENAAYRITTEALSNAARHAGARHVRVVLAGHDGWLRVTIADDGHGVGRALAGVGLTSMRRRAEALGGRIEITSEPTGTCVSVAIPIEEG